MTPHLDAWARAGGTAPVLHLADLVDANLELGVLRSRLSNPWLRDRPDQHAQVRRWLLTTTPDFLPRLETAFLDVTDETTLHKLASTITFAETTAP
jgi:hypothetical protein